MNKGDFQKWLRNEKKMKATTSKIYEENLMAMIKQGVLKNPEDYLTKMHSIQTKQTFRRKYWVLIYYYQYMEKQTGKMIHRMKELEEYENPK